MYEAVGEGDVSFELARVLGINGVFIFTGIPAEKPRIPVFADTIIRNITLKNHALIGTVNASPQAFLGRDPRSRRIQEALAEGDLLPDHGKAHD